MRDDPHDSDLRQEQFRKNDSLEDYLFRLNLHLESFDTKDDGRDEAFPLIYVVGLPRSGTTLLSQLISRYLQVGYINNLIARFWLNPVVGIRLSQAILGPTARLKIEFESIYGVTDGPWGPHEFGYFWRKWLLLDEATTHKLPQSLLQSVDRTKLCAVLQCMAKAFNAPIVFKNIICGLQAEFLTQVYSKSLFVLIERDPEAVKSSLLQARSERYGDVSAWWSLKPSTYESISRIKSPISQIEKQVVDGAKDFSLELAKPSVRSLRIDYESLCADPASCLNLIAAEISSFGCPVSLLERPIKLRRSR